MEKCRWKSELCPDGAVEGNQEPEPSATGSIQSWDFSRWELCEGQELALNTPGGVSEGTAAPFSLENPKWISKEKLLLKTLI